jgi:hypothetical protein
VIPRRLQGRPHVADRSPGACLPGHGDAADDGHDRLHLAPAQGSQLPHGRRRRLRARPLLSRAGPASPRPAHLPITAFGSHSAMPGNISSRVMQIAMPTMNGSTPIQRSTIVPTLSPASSDTDLRMPWMM